MRPLLIALLFAVSLPQVSFAQSKLTVEPLSLGDLDAYFSSIHLQNDGFAFKRNANSRPLICQIGPDVSFISQPGTIFEVKFGSHFRLYDKHSEIKVLAGGRNHGIFGAFLVEETTLRDAPDTSQTVHVGLLRMSPYMTSMPRAPAHLEVLPITTITDGHALLEFETSFADTIAKQ